MPQSDFMSLQPWIKTYKQHGKFFEYLTKMLWQARVLPAKAALPK